MAITTMLTMRQGQSLAMTPQLLQAIKLLQLSNLELQAFLDAELERNPLLETAAEGEARGDEAASADGEGAGAGFEEPREGDWAQESLAVDATELAADLGTEIGNAFEPEPAQGGPSGAAIDGLSAASWSGAAGGSADGEAPDLENYVAAKVSLRDHLAAQLALACPEGGARMIGLAIIDEIDESGYFRGGLDEIAERLGVVPERAAEALALVQTFEPTGVGARDLAECLAIQLRERDRLDPAMQVFLQNLPRLAKREFAALAKLCGVDEEDVADMAAEVRRLDPKPGRAFGSSPVEPLIPDVIVRRAGDGSWMIELNSDALPRVLLNHSYAALVGARAKSSADKSFVSACLQNANWLIKSLDQRARTILKVASEIVRLQDGFLEKGVERLRPLNLRTVADAIGMHESTVSRVTSNKSMSTPRGVFELKYFFSASIAATSGAESHSAEAVRHKIKQMIDKESPLHVLSDDAIVARLKAIDIDIARRTVAKYRDSLHIPSSVDRRRQKLALRQHGGPSPLA